MIIIIIAVLSITPIVVITMSITPSPPIKSFPIKSP